MVGLRANQKPISTPPSEPTTKASIASTSVIHRCFQMVPSTNQRTMREATSSGVEKKNGGNSFTPPIGTVVNTCHSAIDTTATRIWRARSVARFMASPQVRSVPSPLEGEGQGGGSRERQKSRNPTRTPSPQGGGERTARAAKATQNDWPSPSPRLLIALHHLVLQRLPNLAMQLVKRALELHLTDVARARQRHFPVADDARRR